MTTSGSSSYDKIFQGSLVALTNSKNPEKKSYKELTFCREKTVHLNVTKELRLLSWNLLAPPYNRSKKSNEAWRARTVAQIELVGSSNADVIGLQEFWVQNEEYLSLWKTFAAKRGYSMFVSPRTGNKADGCCMLVRLREASLETFSYNDWGDRIVQVVKGIFGEDNVVLIQTHLTFPHYTADVAPMRWHQGKKLGEFIGNFTSSTNIILFGDLNSLHGAADPAVQNIITFGELEDHGPKGVVSHLSHRGDKMESDLVLTSGCRLIRSWFGETEKELVMKQLLSDHRSCHAVLSFESLVSKHGASCDGMFLENKVCSKSLIQGEF